MGSWIPFTNEKNKKKKGECSFGACTQVEGRTKFFFCDDESIITLNRPILFSLHVTYPKKRLYGCIFLLGLLPSVRNGTMRIIICLLFLFPLFSLTSKYKIVRNLSFFSFSFFSIVFFFFLFFLFFFHFFFLSFFLFPFLFFFFDHPFSEVEGTSLGSFFPSVLFHGPFSAHLWWFAFRPCVHF